MVSEMLQDKLGEALGLERAAQNTVEELGSKGLLNEGGMLAQLQKMQTQTGNHELKLEKIINNLTKYSTRMYRVAEETTEKCSKIMQTYLGDNPDSTKAIEFLCLAEGGEIAHYEFLSAMATKLKDKKLSATINTILREEKRHLQLSTRLTKRIASDWTQVSGREAYGPGTGGTGSEQDDGRGAREQ